MTFAAALRPDLHAFLLIVNTPTECVIGGERADVLELAEAVVSLSPCSAASRSRTARPARPVEEPYRELHTLPVTPPEDVTIYSGAWGKRYSPTERNCADSITAGLLNTIDVPAVIEAAYRDGVRVFIEVGPGNSCVRMIDSILGDRPHLARSAHAAKQDAVSQVLRLLAHLTAERVPVDLAALYGRETRCVGHREPLERSVKEVVIPVGRRPESAAAEVPRESRSLTHQTPHLPMPLFANAITPAIEAVANVQVLTMQAQEAFLRVSNEFTKTAAGWFGSRRICYRPSRSGAAPIHHVARETGSHTGSLTASRLSQDPPRALSYEQCCNFATGRVSDVLGPLFAAIDAFPDPRSLARRPACNSSIAITLIEGEPLR